MGELDKHIRKTDERSPYEKIAVNPIEKDRKQKEPPFFSTQDETKPALSLLFAYLQKLLKPIVSRAGSRSAARGTSPTRALLKEIRKLLSLLASEDRSYNPDFNFQFAQLWHTLLDDCNKMQSLQIKSTPFLERLKFFISQIENFPIGSDYTLGYYLSHEIGKDWNPFPCMQLLKELHDEFTQAPSHSALHNWILLIDEILSL